MDNYEERQGYYNNFWMKEDVLYLHSEEILKELLNFGNFFEKLAKLANEFSENILKAKNITEKSEINNDKNPKKKKKEEGNINNFFNKQNNSTRSVGIKVMFEYTERLSKSLNYLASTLYYISDKILDNKDTFDSKKPAKKICDDTNKNFKNALNELNKKKESYYDSINKGIEYHLSHLNAPSKAKDKYKEEIQKKGNEYLAKVKLVETIRTDYSEEQGSIFCIIEEMERDYIDDLKSCLLKFIEGIKKFQKDIEFNESEIKKIEEIDGEKDIQSFTEQNKSLIDNPKKALFEQYKPDMNYYMQNFKFLRKVIKNKSPNDLKIFKDNISKEVNSYLKEIIVIEKDDIKEQTLNIAKTLNESKLQEDDFNYLIVQFEERFKQYKDYRSNEIMEQNFLKVGEKYENRYFYAQTFLEYFQKIEEQDLCFNEGNFNYFCKIIEKILELNMDEDIDYNLCNMIISLSSKIYMVDKSKKSGKKYVFEIIRNCPLMQKQLLWVGLTKMELKKEIVKQKIEIEDDKIKENDIPEEILNRFIATKLIDIISNAMKLINDSQAFNKIVFDIFKYCKIDKNNRITIINRIDLNRTTEDVMHITIDSNLLFSDY